MCRYPRTIQVIRFTDHVHSGWILYYSSENNGTNNGSGIDNSSSPDTKSSYSSDYDNLTSSLREDYRLIPSSPNPKPTTINDAFHFHERLERIEKFLYPQASEDDTQAIEGLKDFTQQSAIQKKVADQRLEKFESLIERTISQAAQKIESNIEERFVNFEENLRQRTATQFSLDTFEDVLEHHLENLEVSFSESTPFPSSTDLKISLPGHLHQLLVYNNVRICSIVRGKQY